ncbi:MAG: tripartite tricarboxylate transporter TctB family protein [Synergistaceae bacterium]|nr:tripartite tricarboxylate transporter TctB family protein [Synergistaceae bacterium]MBQ3586673.1 tripartite tricarboxylate transporter TctB family protein [Synergistaceae bacterium]MBQ6002332.1 tripartite tricarboxylate transporter TctB family protein [Synergistaceae bacterium]MBR0168236.1 tripartite tricarboxylate transporter TctB family protein [Synergistaceae bacterium]
MADIEKEYPDLNPDLEVDTDDMIVVKEHPLEAGEKVFSFILLIVGVIALKLSVDLWFSISLRRGPRIASAAAVPVFVSALWVIMSLWTVIENFKLSTPLSKVKGMGEKIMKALAYALPLNVLIMLVLIVAYCVALVEGVSFYIATPAFLYISMCYLMRKDYVKNILWTGIVMAFIVVVFRLLFSVVFP